MAQRAERIEWTQGYGLCQRSQCSWFQEWWKTEVRQEYSVEVLKNEWLLFCQHLALACYLTSRFWLQKCTSEACVQDGCSFHEVLCKVMELCVVYECLSMRLVRSGEVYNMDKTGPCTEPRGTPQTREDSADWWSSTGTNCFVSERYKRN